MVKFRWRFKKTNIKAAFETGHTFLEKWKYLKSDAKKFIIVITNRVIMIWVWNSQIIVSNKETDLGYFTAMLLQIRHRYEIVVLL